MVDSGIVTATVERHRRESVAAVRAPYWRSEAVRFALLASPFFATAAAYEVLRVLSPLHGRIRVAELRALERWFFPAGGGRTLSDVIAGAQHPVLDLLCAFTYLLFMAEVVALAIYFYFVDRRRMLVISLGFFVVNVVGWLIWLAYPAAPPWYADLHGVGPAAAATASNAAALARVDLMLGVPLFATIYAQSAYVFGAIPSLHASYSTLAALASYRHGKVVRAGTLVFLGWMAYSAVYLRHHYVVDVVAGVLLAGVVFGVLTAVLRGRVRKLVGDG